MTRNTAHKLIPLLVLPLVLLLLSYSATAQEEEDIYYTSQLDTLIENVNQVFKPLITISPGIMSFWGDMSNNLNSPMNGELGFRIGTSTFVGKKKQLYKMNFFACYGNLSGYDFTTSQKMQDYCTTNDIVDMNNNPIYPSSAFKTQFFQMGVTFEYGFGHIFGIARKFKPFISAGISAMQFSPKGNYTYIAPNGSKNYYHHWSDGTMRNFRENGENAYQATIVHYDSEYETNLKQVTGDIFGTNYSNTTFTIPVGIGFDFYLSERINLRVGIDVNYAFTDMLDSYDNALAKKINATPKNSLNDIFTFTYFGLNFDLFSDAKTILLERLYADIDFDEVLLYDEDNDMIFDIVDNCLGTPYGVAVDSVGCPLDSDNDGVPDYLDKEPNTPLGATVDEHGVQMSEGALTEIYGKANSAADRNKAMMIPLVKVWTRSITYTPGIIPDKFKTADKDGDGYISFEEVLKVISDFFDEKNSYTTEDINELNSFFFSQ